MCIRDRLGVFGFGSELDQRIYYKRIGSSLASYSSTDHAFDTTDIRGGYDSNNDDHAFLGRLRSRYNSDNRLETTETSFFGG